MSENSVSNVPLTKVTLYKHGIGYFERRGQVNGPTAVELQCGPEEIDDMLKSLLVLKKGGGRISAVTYESSKPLAERLQEFGFDLRNSHSFVDLVGQLKGTPVVAKLGSKELAGRVVGLDASKRVIEGTVVDERFLLLFSQDNVLLRIEVGSMSGLEVKDSTLAAELQQQLELLFLAVKKKDRKLLKVDIPDGAQDLMIAYSIPCPIWKTSYRLLFDSEERLLIQGVAIVDNVQEEDWTDVKMVLVSASPVSFIQPLYEPIKIHRRTIQAQGFRSQGPFVTEGADAPVISSLKKRARAENAPMQALAAMAPPAGGGMGGDSWGQVQYETPVDMLGEMERLDVNSAEKGEQFEYQIGGTVTVPRNSSALIPVVQEHIEGERLSLYNETRDSGFPYATVKLKNTTGLTLEAGPVTVMEDDSYAGECLLDVLKPDDTRFLPYAVDQAVKVVVRNEYERKPVWRVRVHEGFLQLHHNEVSKKVYNLENLATRKKIVYVEHPLREGWTLKCKDKPAETTKSFYRFRVELDSKQLYALDVEEVNQVVEQYQLVGLDPNWYYWQWLFAQNYSSPKFLEFMREIQKRRQELLEMSNEISQLNQRQREFVQEQERARENVKTLGSSGERFKQAIEASEDKILENQKAIAALNEKVKQKTAELHRVVQVNIDSELKA